MRRTELKSTAKRLVYSPVLKGSRTNRLVATYNKNKTSSRELLYISPELLANVCIYVLTSAAKRHASISLLAWNGAQ